MVITSTVSLNLLCFTHSETKAGKTAGRACVKGLCFLIPRSNSFSNQKREASWWDNHAHTHTCIQQAARAVETKQLLSRIAFHYHTEKPTNVHVDKGRQEMSRSVLIELTKTNTVRGQYNTQESSNDTVKWGLHALIFTQRKQSTEPKDRWNKKVIALCTVINFPFCFGT